MILEVFMVFICLGSMNVMTRYNHPMFFGFGLLAVVVWVSSVLSFYNGIFGFMVFMCVVSGVLVVFAYSVALAPLMLSKEEYEKMEKEQEGLYNNLGGPYVGWFLTWNSLLFCCLIVVLLTFVDFSSIVGVFPSIFCATNNWGVGVCVFSFVLFMLMVFCVGVAGEYKGALIK